MKVIFLREDFTLCNVPVPKGYKQSQTHAGVSLFNGDFFLTTSPYPSYARPIWIEYFKVIIRKLSCGLLFRPFIAEQWENPCLYIGVDSNGNIPKTFKLLQQSPLMTAPDPYYGFPSYNSDPDICIVDGKLHILNRSVFRLEKNQKNRQYRFIDRLFHIYGSIDNKRFKCEGTELLFETKRILASPCITFFNDEYLLTEIETNSYNDGETYNGLYMARSSSIDGFKNDIQWEAVNVIYHDFLPWHMSIFQHDGRLYSIIACVKKGEKQRCWQMFGEFNTNLSQLKIYKTPLTDYKSYRGAACVTPEGEFILYSTTVHEKIKGSKAVDGRDVIMAHMPFARLLETLRKNENE